MKMAEYTDVNKMKIIAIGDIHGRNIWKEIVIKEDANMVIFIGDYFDTHNQGHSPNNQIENFKEIVAYKKTNPNKVILLFGNHDFHYIRNIGETYSGYNAAYAHDIGEQIDLVIKEDLVQMCYLYNKFFFSHAGLTKTWAEIFLGNPNIIINEVIVQAINDLFKFTPNVFKFRLGDNLSQTGDDVNQSPIWVRPASLLKNMVDDITCIVGHTTVTRLGLDERYPKLILIDCLGTSGEYLIIENNLPRIGKLLG